MEKPGSGKTRKGITRAGDKMGWGRSGGIREPCVLGPGMYRPFGCVVSVFI